MGVAGGSKVQLELIWRLISQNRSSVGYDDAATLSNAETTKERYRVQLADACRIIDDYGRKTAVVTTPNGLKVANSSKNVLIRNVQTLTDY